MKLRLTASQLSLWVGQKMNPDTPMYNTAASYDIAGAIDVDVFRRAFQLLINSTDALRIQFTEEDGIPYQAVREPFRYEPEIIDFSHSPGDADVFDWLVARSRQKLDLADRVFDAALLKITDKRYIWFLNMHHLVTDAVSRRIIFNRMAKLYAGLKVDETLRIENPAFLDYVTSQLELENAQTDSQNYWTDRIRDLGKTPLFYGVRQAGKATETTRVSLRLGPERSGKLKALAQRPDLRSWTEHLALFNILSGLLFVYMYRISGEKKLAMGTPLHNRVSKKYNETVGYFLEIFPLVTEINDQDTFNTLLQRVKLETNENLKHALQSTVSQEISRSFNVVLNYIHTSFPDFNGLKTTSNWVFPQHMDSGHQMRCHVVDFEGTGEIELLFDFNHETFNQALRQRAPQHFLNLMDAMLSNPDTPLDQPSISTGEEKHIAVGKSQLRFTYSSFYELFATSVAAHPGAVALRFGQGTISYGALNEMADVLAAHLSELGIRAGHRIALYNYRSPEYIICVWAAVKLGATFVPIASDQPVERISYILGNADCSLVLTNSLLKENLQSTDVKVLEISLEYLEELGASERVYFKGTPQKEALAYILYTSGSTGHPKGVRISHGALSNYLLWAKDYYEPHGAFTFPFYTSIGFDLTITSLFLPLLSGGELVIYLENASGPDISLLTVIEENKVNAIKITPAHINLLQGMDLSGSKIRTMIVGGEDFTTRLAQMIHNALGGVAKIYNEYGPTEASVGCIVSRFNESEHLGLSVPIGNPIRNMHAYVLDTCNNIVPEGVVGELYLSGVGLSKGYAGMQALTNEKFVENPFLPDAKMYRTGDLGRVNMAGELEYLGRIDEQVKLNGFRIELPDIEANLSSHPEVEAAAVVVLGDKKNAPEHEIENCRECGLPSNFPNADFDANGVCHLCNSFKGYKEKTAKYFKTEDDLRQLLHSEKGRADYDCLSLLSGGKDSTYVLAKLISMGLKVLAFTLDNGYISEQAKANIDRIVKRLGVDHIYGETAHMNKIFVDSLRRHHNVCNGCFKTIYTLSTAVALEKNIPFIVTGLSRGQFFETRLTEELFWNESADMTVIDDTILEARKLYHQEEDAVKQHLDVSMFKDEATFNKVQFVDFYRYSDVSLTEMLQFLKEKADWVRPTDTGRSTNCLINQVGIYVHKKEKGYSNYSFPYSWDVRLGHKTRAETLDEINEYIDEQEVKRIMKRIGYDESYEQYADRKRLVGYYTGNSKISSGELNRYLSKKLPQYMIPVLFKRLNELPLTVNGKVDRKMLGSLNEVQLEMDTPFVAPRNDIEELIEGIWKEVMQLNKIGIHDNFIMLGGHSLAAIRVTSRINDELEMNFPLNKIFELPTIAEYAGFIEETLTELLE